MADLRGWSDPKQERGKSTEWYQTDPKHSIELTLYGTGVGECRLHVNGVALTEWSEDGLEPVMDSVERKLEEALRTFREARAEREGAYA